MVSIGTKYFTYTSKVGKEYSHKSGNDQPGSRRTKPFSATDP